MNESVEFDILHWKLWFFFLVKNTDVGDLLRSSAVELEDAVNFEEIQQQHV